MHLKKTTMHVLHVGNPKHPIHFYTVVYKHITQIHLHVYILFICSAE